MLDIQKSSDYFTLCTIDFVSLQSILAAADCGINPSGVDTTMLEIYGEGGHEDMHSATSYGTFGKAVKLEVLEFEDENGKKWSMHEKQYAKIRRSGVEMEVQAGDINCNTDEIIEKVDHVAGRTVS